MYLKSILLSNLTDTVCVNYLFLGFSTNKKHVYVWDLNLRFHWCNELPFKRFSWIILYKNNKVVPFSYKRNKVFQFGVSFFRFHQTFNRIYNNFPHVIVTAIQKKSNFRDLFRTQFKIYDETFPEHIFISMYLWKYILY